MNVCLAHPYPGLANVKTKIKTPIAMLWFVLGLKSRYGLTMWKSRQEVNCWKMAGELTSILDRNKHFSLQTAIVGCTILSFEYFSVSLQALEQTILTLKCWYLWQQNTHRAVQPNRLRLPRILPLRKMSEPDLHNARSQIFRVSTCVRDDRRHSPAACRSLNCHLILPPQPPPHTLSLTHTPSPRATTTAIHPFTDWLKPVDWLIDTDSFVTL